MEINEIFKAFQERGPWCYEHHKQWLIRMNKENKQYHHNVGFKNAPQPCAVRRERDNWLSRNLPWPEERPFIITKQVMFTYVCIVLGFKSNSNRFSFLFTLVSSWPYLLVCIKCLYFPFSFWSICRPRFLNDPSRHFSHALTVRFPKNSRA